MRFFALGRVTDRKIYNQIHILQTGSKAVSGLHPPGEIPVIGHAQVHLILVCIFRFRFCLFLQLVILHMSIHFQTGLGHIEAVFQGYGFHGFIGRAESHGSIQFVVPVRISRHNYPQPFGLIRCLASIEVVAGNHHAFYPFHICQKIFSDHEPPGRVCIRARVFRF